MRLVVAILVIAWQLQHQIISAQQCPALSNVNPKSGLESQLFIITGSNLNGVSDITSSAGTVNYTVVSSVQVNFRLIGSSGIITVRLTPSLATCNSSSFTLDIKTISPLVSTISSNNGQPGTVLKVTGCFPSVCGDNSTTYSIEIGGINGNVISSAITGANNDNTFYVQLTPIDSSISNANINLISQYGTVYPLSFSGTFDYELPGNIENIVPFSGQNGTEVTIMGTNLIGLGGLNIELTSVSFGDVLTTIISSSQTEVVVRVYSGSPGPRTVQLNSTQYSDNNTPLGGPHIISTDLWTQLEDGIITNLIPPAGQENSTLYVCGERLKGNGTVITNVSIADTPVLTFTNDLVANVHQLGLSDECISVVVPPQLNSSITEGVVNIISDTKAIVSTKQGLLFHYADISSVSPNQGQEFTHITISGSHLLSGYNSSVTPTVFLGNIQAIVLSHTTTEIIVEASPAENITNMSSDLIIEVTQYNITSTLTLSDAWTYLPNGIILTAVPSNGIHGIYINVTGNNLLGYGTALETAYFLGTSSGSVSGDPMVAAEIISYSESSVVLAVPLPSNQSYIGPVDILLVADNGAHVIGSDVFSYISRGIINSVTPAQGQGGTYVTLSGFELFGYGSNVSIVKFGEVEADIIYDLASNSSITVRVGNYMTFNDTSVNITILADNNAVVTSTELMWTYLRTGEILSVTPSRGQFGSLVTVTGISLLGGGTNISSIYIDGVPPLLITEYNSTQIVLKLGNETLRDDNFPSNEVYIESDTGAIVKGGYFQQLAPGMITSFTPTSGRRGTELTINGYNLTGHGELIINVIIAGFESVSSSYQTTNDDTELIVQVGSAPNGTVGRIRLITDTGAIIESTTLFTYLQQGIINGVSPLTGAEGTGVLITGTSLQIGAFSITSVTIGGSPVTRIVTTSPDHVSIIAGPAPTDLVNQTIRLVSPDGSYVDGGYFTYENLSISIVGSNEGQYGTQITLSIPFLVTDLANVLIGSQEASILSTDLTSSTVTVAVPRATMLGQYSTDVVIESTENTVVRLQNGFTYLPEGIIESVQPNFGQKGTQVIIKGERLLGGGVDIFSVTIGGISAEVNEFSNDTVNVRVGSYSNSVGSYPYITEVSIISNTGAIVTRLQSFTYVQPGQITSITPSIGQYGTIVTIRGTRLLQERSLEVTSVTLAGIEAVVVSTPNDTYIQVQAMPSSAPVIGNVTITLSSGAQISSSNNVQFQYQQAGIIDMVTPSIGTTGTNIKISGSNLLGGGTRAQTVTLNGVPADIVTDSNSQVTVRANLDHNIIGEAGPVQIISNTGSIVSLNNSWTYEELGNVTSFTPLSGQQGITVTIQGESLIGTSGSHIIEVTLAGVLATIVSQSNSTVEVIAGYSNVSVSGPIEITAFMGSVITSNAYWSYYKAGITSISPKRGVHGTYVTLDGINLTGEPENNDTIASITFGTIDAYDILILSQNTIQVRAGRDSVHSIGPLTVNISLTSGIFLTLDNQWTYQTPGHITSIAPATGAPGENITIYGSSLVPTDATGVSVTIGNSEAFEAAVTLNTTSVVQFRVGVYQSVDLPNVLLPILIESNDGSIVYNATQNLFSFIETGNVTFVYPVAGGSGSTVEINGTDLLSGSTGISNVYIAGIAVADIISYSSTSVLVTTGTGNNVSGSVIIESNNGLFTGLADEYSWSYLPTLNSTHVSPLSGRNGTLVTIETALIPSKYLIEYVTISGVQATIVSTDSNKLIVMATEPLENTPPIGDVILHYQDDIILIIHDTWTYLSPVMITNISTSVGYYKSFVVINGLEFRTGGSEVQSVLLAGFSTNIINQSDTELRLIINEQFDSSGSGNITGPIVIIGTDGSTYTSNVTFTYLQLSVTSVSPNHGQYGTIVTIKGVGLLAGGNNVTSMYLANVPVNSILSTSNSEIKAIASLSSTGTELSDIIFTVDTGAQVTIATSWYYVPPGSITSINPSSGQQGTLVTITGKGMLRGGEKPTDVFLSGVKAMEIIVGHDTFIRVRAGLNPEARAAGEVTIISDTGAQITSNISQASYEYLAPGNISSVTPTDGQYGTRISIEGTSLYTESSGIDYASISYVQASLLSYNTTVIEVMIQRTDVLNSIQGPITIVSRDGSVVMSSTNFTYLQEGQIHIVIPQQGQKGANVVITGGRLRGGGSHIETVLVSGTQADVITQTDTELTVVINENIESYNSAVTGDIVIISNTGSEVRRIDGWTYTQVGIMESISPADGQYGTYVTITGERLTSGGSSVNVVYIGNVPSLEVISSNSSIVIFRAGESNSSFNSSISLISNYNSNLTSTENVTWTYLESSIVLLVEPSNSTGGMIVNVTGRNLFGGGSSIVSVSLAGIEVRDIVDANDSFIEIITGFNPDGQPKVGDIRIESNTGALTIVPDGWSYESECPLGQYGNNTNSCSPCHPECEHCYGPTQRECYSCKNFKIILDIDDNIFECINTCPSLSTIDKQCVDNCLTNQYQQISILDGQTYCLNCHPLCNPNLSCTGSLASQCTACAYYIEDATCVQECSIGTYISNNTCLPCSEQCLPSENCTGPATYHCNQCANVSIAQSIDNVTYDVCITECPTRYYTDQNQICQYCHDQCQGGCSGPFSTQCSSCANAYIVHDDNLVECVSSCNEISDDIKTMYQDPVTGECKPCHRLCSIVDGCTGPMASDCILCSNFTGNNKAPTEFVPKLNGECVQVCPNESYYADLRNGNCELCDPACTIGCYGPYSSDCIIEPSDSPTDAGVNPFDAGIGTIVIVVVVILILLIALVILVIALIVKMRAKEQYNLRKDEEQTSPMHHQMVTAPATYKKNPISETNIPSEFMPPTLLSAQAHTFRHQHVEISEMNPAYIETTNIELLEEDEASLARSIEDIHDSGGTSRPVSPLSNATSSPDEKSTLLKSSQIPPPIPKKGSFPPPSTAAAVGAKPGQLDDIDHEPSEIYTEMDNDLTQEEYTDMEAINLPLPSNIIPALDTEEVYEVTDSTVAGVEEDYRELVKIPHLPVPYNHTIPPAIPPRASISIQEQKPALPPRAKRSSSDATIPQRQSSNENTKVKSQAKK